MSRTTSGGVEVAFEAEGDGPPLVLLHGLSDARAFWREAGYADIFLAAGRRVVLIDATGHGESGKPHDPAAYSLERRAAAVVAVLDTLGIERADVLGYSLGGWTPLGLALHFPDRVGAAIAGGAHPYAESMADFRRAIGAGLAAWAGIVETMRGTLPAPMRARILANDAEALAASLAGDRSDISAGVAGAGVPLMLYAGDADPRHAPAMRFARETGARFLTLPGTNHVQALWRSDEVTRETLAFLRETHCRAA
jgi:pimeloyl-ACP methyl ester carboxylesterase